MTIVFTGSSLRPEAEFLFIGRHLPPNEKIFILCVLCVSVVILL
jgi:hypothetical protein